MGLETALQYGLLGALGGGAKVIQSQEEDRRKQEAKFADDAARTDRENAIEQARYERNRTDKTSDDEKQRTHERGLIGLRAKADPVENELRAAQAEKLRIEMANEKEIKAMRESLAQAEGLARNDPSLQSLVDARRQKLNTLLGAKPTESYSIRTVENPDTGERENITELKGSGALPGETKAAAVPQGLPPGSKQIGTSGGKPVYQTPDGRKLIGD